MLASLNLHARFAPENLRLLLAGFLGWNAAQAQYCTPTYGSGCTFADDLNSFSLSNLSHLNTGCGPNNGYENYTATAGVDTIQLEQGVSYNLSATTNYSSSEYLAIWIDFNNDQDFADPGELLYTSGSFGSGSPLTATLAMPTGQPTGYRRLRARVIFALSGTPDPCNNYSYGEAHDYTVNVLPVPSCLPVSNVDVPSATITSSQANVTWTSAGNDFDVQYGLAGFSLGTGTTVTNIAATNYTIMGLSPNTQYDVYVRQDCGVNGFSTWTKKAFFTKCAATALPFTEDFNTWPPNCFSLAGGNQNFISYNLSGGGLAAQAQMGNWFGQGSALITTQSFIVTGPSRVKFKWSHAYNQFSPNESLLIEAKLETAPTYTDTIFFKSGTNFESNDGATGFSPGTFLLDLANLPAGMTGNVVIRVTASSQGFGNSLWIDDFTVEAQPACAEPTNFQFTGIGYNQASFSYTAATTNTYQIQWGVCGFDQSTGGAFVSLTGTSNSLTGLAPNTCYDIYIRTDCNPANGYSGWMGPYSFTTSCFELQGWQENFDLLSVYQPAPCWNMINGGTGGTASQTVVPPFGVTVPSTPHALEYWNSSSTDHTLATPALNGLDADTNQVKFKMASQNPGPFTVYVGTMASSASSAGFVYVDTLTVTNAFADYTVRFENVPTGHFYVGIKSALPIFNSLFIDNLKYEAIPS